MTDYLERIYDWDDPKLIAVFDEVPFWSAIFGKLLFRYIPLRPNMAVLDLGCGAGFPLLELAQRLGPSCLAVGLDPWHQALTRLQTKRDILDVRQTAAVLGDGAALPFAAGTFDLIVSNVGINNFAEPETILAECARAIKTGGHIALTTNLKGHMEEFYQVFTETLREQGKTDRLPTLQAHIEHRGTIAGLSAMLAAAGFRVTAIQEDTFTMRFLDGSALLQHTFIQRVFLDTWRTVLETAEDERTVFSRLEQNLNLRAANEGELALSIPMAYIEARQA